MPSSPLPPDLVAAHPRRVPADRVRDRLLELLGLEELPTAVDYRVEKTREEDGLVWTWVAYANSLGETLKATMLWPPSVSTSTPLAGVVAMHGTGGDVAQVVAPRLDHDDGGQLCGWGRELARRGHAVICFSLKGSHARSESAEAWEAEARLLEAYGRPHMGILVEEVLLATRVLGAQAAVDPERIGVTGMSLGGVASWYAAACDERIAAAAPICGSVGSLARLIHEGNPWRHSSYLYVPHLLRYFDHEQIVAHCVAPRPLLVVAPTDDEDMPRAGVEQMAAVAREAYASHGVADHLSVRQPPGRHRFERNYFEWMVAWFERHL